MKNFTSEPQSAVWIFIFFTAALIEGTIFAMHGGLSPDLNSLEQVI